MCYSIFILPPPPAAPDGPGPQHSDGCHRHAPCRARSKDGSVASSGGQGLRAGDSATTAAASGSRSQSLAEIKKAGSRRRRRHSETWQMASSPLARFYYGPGKLVICPPGDGGAAVPRPAPDLVRGSQAGATAACAVAGAGGVRRCPGRQAAGQIGRPGSLAGSGSLSVSGPSDRGRDPMTGRDRRSKHCQTMPRLGPAVV